MSANKAERVIEIDQICGRLYEERRMRLELMPYRVGYPIFKLVYSAATNAIHNVGLNEASLIISKAEVVKGYYCEKIKTSSSRAQLSDKKTRFSYNYWIKRYICKGSIKEPNTPYYTSKATYGEIKISKYTDMTCHDIYSIRRLWDKK